MHNHYIINNTFEFHPATSTIRDLNDPTNVVVLNSPAGRCLLLLINRQGNIVTQHDVMDTVWEQSGMQVSPNTYYQNISILRKGLKKIGIGEELIVTIPRIGLTLASGTHIRKLIAENEVEIDHENTHFINELDDHLAPPAALPDGHIDPAPDYQDEPSISLMPSKQEESHFRWYKGLSRRQIVSAVTAIVVIITLITIFTIFSVTKSNYRYFDKYTLVPLRSSCIVHLSNNIKNIADKTKALSYVNNFENSCQSYPWVYISRFPGLARTSVIRCDAPMSKPNTCISDYYVEKHS